MPTVRNSYDFTLLRLAVYTVLVLVTGFVAIPFLALWELYRAFGK